MHIEARGVAKAYGGQTELAGINLVVPSGQRVAVIGPSGSGKTTLLGCLAALVPLTAGQVLADGQILDLLSPNKLVKFRSRAFGVVSARAQLVPELSVLENTALPLLILGYKSKPAYQMAQLWLDRLGIGFMRSRASSLLSEEEAYQVSVARALVHSPQVVFVDEPASALDVVRTQEAMQLLASFSQKTGASLLVSTRSADVAAWCERHIHMQDGLIVADSAWGMPADGGAL